MPNFTKSWVSQSVLGWCVTCILLKRGAKLRIFLERFLLSPIWEKIFASEQSLKETHSFASSFNPRRVTHQSKTCRGPYLNSKYLISKNSFGIKRNLWLAFALIGNDEEREERAEIWWIAVVQCTLQTRPHTQLCLIFKTMQHTLQSQLCNRTVST